MNNQQDLKILLDDTFVNIKVAILLETSSGFIFEKSKNGYLFLVGGRIKLNETTQQAASREIFEELGLKNINMKLVSVVENFFEENNKKFHEINFVYKATLTKPIDLSVFISESNENEGFCYIKLEDLDQHDIRPKIIRNLFKNKKEFLHLVNFK